MNSTYVLDIEPSLWFLIESVLQKSTISKRVHAIYSRKGTQKDNLVDVKKYCKVVLLLTFTNYCLYNFF